MKRLLIASLLVLSTVLVPSRAWAQSLTSGSIAGTVKDATGAVLPGVTVEASSPALIEKVRSVATDSSGNYKIVDLRPGTYAVTFTLPGFSTFKREGLELTTGFTATANAEMKLGALEETVTVTGATPVVDVQNVRTQNLMSREVLDTVPTGKTIQGFGAITLGMSVSLGSSTVMQQDVGGNKGEYFTALVVHGSRLQDEKLLYDGMGYNYPSAHGGGNARIFLVNQMGVQEVSVSTSANTAESEVGGVQVNYVPKDGGNTVRGSFIGAYTNNSLQGANLSDEIRARGLTTTQSVKQIWDWGGGVGGPIKKDKLWFYTSHRWWGAQEYQPGAYFKIKDSNPLFLAPDLSRPAYYNPYNEDHGARLTLQITPKQKTNVTSMFQRNCSCISSVGATTMPEAAWSGHYTPYLVQANWSYPMTSRLLFEAGGTYGRNRFKSTYADGVTADTIGITELSTGVSYGALVPANGIGQGGGSAYGGWTAVQNNERFAVSYVTGSHALKAGFTLWKAWQTDNFNINQSLSYQFRFQRPVSLTQWVSPISGNVEGRGTQTGLYVQDQWTMKRITLNMGVRFSSFTAYVPPQHLEATRFVAARDFPRVDNVPNWKDLTPRIGLSYDLFGNGRTALKGSVGRYVVSQALGTPLSNNPLFTIVGRSDRTWTDADADYVPDCDLLNQGANGECGALANRAFGTPVVNTRYDPAILTGWNTRPNDWQTSAVLQQELWPGAAVSVGYYRTWYGNFTVTDNLATTPADFDQYCITVPTDSRLPGGGGDRLCGLYDVNPAKFGRFDNFVTSMDKFGKQTEVFDGVDVGFTMRLGKAFVTGGVSGGRTALNNCVTVDSPQAQLFCKIAPPWLPQIKANGVVPLPWWGLEASGTFQNLGTVPVTASYVATNTEIAPSLGRNLAAGPAGTVVVPNLYDPVSVYEKRLTQVDLRLIKNIRFGQARVRGMFDVYNTFNGSAVIGLNTRYGAAWLRPSGILGGRLFKFGAQVDF